MSPTNDTWGMLVSVACILNVKLGGFFLSHVGVAITNFIGLGSGWTLSRACNEDHPRLMKLLAARHGRVSPDARVLAAMCNTRLNVAATTGSLRVFQAFTRYFPTMVITTAAEVAAGAGHAHIVSWLLDQDLVVWREEALVAATSHGSISGVTRLLRGLFWQPSVAMLHVAIERGHVDLAQWLWLDFCGRDCFEGLDEALAASPILLAQWMASRSPSSLRVSIDIAAQRGDLRWIKWAHARGAVATVVAMDSAAANGHGEVLDWLHINRSEGSSATVIDHVAKFGRLPIVQWLHQVGGRAWTSEAVFNAAVNGHLDVLRWLLQSRSDIECPPSTLDVAAANGHLAVVEWMTTTNTGSATHCAMDWAATNGHDEVVFYLHLNRREGCTTAAMDGAAANGHHALLHFLGDQRREGCTTAAFDNAARNGHRCSLAYLESLRSEGFTSAALVNAASSGNGFIVQWLLETHHTPLTTEVVDAAIGSGNIALVRYLVKGYNQWGTKAGVDAAIMAGHFPVLAYLQTQRPIYCSATAVRAALQAGNLYLASWAFKNCSETVYLDANNVEFLRRGWSRKIVRAAFE